MRTANQPRGKKKNNKKRSKNLTLIITSADKEQTLQGNEKKKSWQIDCRVCSFILFLFLQPAIWQKVG